MAKDKAGSGAKAKKAKVPKHIGGVKIPKTLRDTGKAAIKLSRNPAARQLLTAGLAAAASAVASNERARKATVAGAREAGDSMSDAADNAADAAGKIGAALIGAATSAAQRFLGLSDDEAINSRSATPAVPPVQSKAADVADELSEASPAQGAAAEATVATPPRRPTVPPRRKPGAGNGGSTPKGR